MCKERRQERQRRADRHVCGCGTRGVDRTGSPGGTFRKSLELEQRVSAFPPLGDKGRLGKSFQGVSRRPDFEYLMIDATIVRTHQHAAGANGQRK